MRGAHHLEPLLGVHLVRADDRPHLIVEDLRRGAGQCAKPSGFKLGQEVAQRQPERRGALRHLQRRERVHMHIGQRGLDRAADADIRRAGVVGMDAALQAHFRRAALPCLPRTPHHFVQCQIVRRAAQFLVRLALGERAELAAIIADVGVVDVAVDHVTHDVAADRLTQRIRCGDHMLIVGIARREQPHDLGFVQPRAGDRFHHRVADRRIDSLQHRRALLRQHSKARRPVVVARPPLGVDRASHTGGDSGRTPAVRFERIRGIYRQPLHQHLAHRGGALRKGLDLRPRCLGVDVIRGHRRHAAPVVDARVDQLLVDARRQVRRRLHMHIVRQDQPRRGDGP